MHVSFDPATGAILGFHDPAFARLPADVIEIDEATWQDAVSHPGKYVVGGGRVQPAVGWTDPATDPQVAARRALAMSDAEMARVTEDVLTVLLAKGTITKSDFDPQVVAKINARRALRGKPAL